MGLLAVALVVGGALLGYVPLIAVGTSLAVVLVVEVVAVLRAAPVSVRREVSARAVPRGEPTTARLVVTSERRPGLVELELADLVDGVRTPVTGDGLTYEVPTWRRGVVQVGPLVAARVGGFGLASRTTPVGGVDEVRVLPRLRALHGLPAGRRRAAAGTADRVEHGGTDIVGLHEYVIGDDLRRLHWATSARTGTLMVREDADPADAHLLVLLDDRSTSYGTPEQAPEQEFEEAVEVAFAVCSHAVDTGRPVHLQTVSGRVDVDVPAASGGGSRASAQAGELAEVLAELDLAPDRATPAVLPHRDLDVVVAVTGRLEVGRDLAAVCAGAASTTLVCIAPEVDEQVVGLGSALALAVPDAGRAVAGWLRVVGR